MQALPLDKPEARQIGRFFIAGAIDAEVDKQGRILLPGNLLNYAAIEKEAVVAGVGNRVEIWSSERWSDTTTFEDINDIAAKMSEWGLSI